MKNGNERVKEYAGILTAVVVFVIYVAVMLGVTNKDMLEIIVSYMAFLAVPAFMVPYFIGGEEDDAE